ncbi:HAUS augmin-like complex subunit 4 [Gadus macrocephalus]|uniref:HAUS augmin-like complex subunit 4 n=1 Tax=Gadus macrocephalus TaxID=80720 RepID=UPI0028CB278A|nr:HAUS augmin-like complex subunit 4 [Gadus macrocephalus]
MMSSAETVSESSLGKGDNLHQEVLASFPLCDLTEEDLMQNPKLCKLLATLSQHVDQTGLSAPLKTDLEKAEQKLQNQRRRWLQVESLHRTLQEMMQDHHVKKHRTTLPPDVTMFFATLERCLLVAQCVRQLDLSTATTTTTTTTPQTGTDRPSLLGLDPQQVLELLPTEKIVQRMKQSLPKELERHLKTKCFSLLSYYQPDWESESDGLKNIKLAHLSGQLDREKKRAESLNEVCRENAVLLQRQTQLYVLELSKCIQLLQSLILDHRLTIQTQLDHKKLEYLEAKCELVMQKIRMESVEIGLDTYTADTIAAHKKIRDLLESELKDRQLEKQSVGSKLASFEMLGTEFEALADEYARLQGEINVKKWALKEFHEHAG